MKQSELQHRLKTLIKNGKSAEVQAILEPLGYGPAVLDEAGQKRLDWNRLRRLADDLLAVQKKATELEEEVENAASSLATKFKRVGRRMFKHDKPALTRLGLYPPRWSSAKKPVNGTANDPDQGEPAAETANGSRRPRRPSFSTSAKADRWQMLFSKALELPEEDRDRLTERGWTTERLTEAVALVEAYAEADIDQQQKIQAYNEAVSAASAAAAELEAWYKEARGYILAEIDDLPPKKRARIKRLLGL
ncbi:MAG TPA: hypothetical protein VGD99_06110 [Anaerolineae bacterium]|jgi:hypothetical protein